MSSAFSSISRLDYCLYRCLFMDRMSVRHNHRREWFSRMLLELTTWIFIDLAAAREVKHRSLRCSYDRSGRRTRRSRDRQVLR